MLPAQTFEAGPQLAELVLVAPLLLGPHQQLQRVPRIDRSQALPDTRIVVGRKAAVAASGPSKLINRGVIYGSADEVKSLNFRREASMGPEDPRKGLLESVLDQ